MKIEVDVEQFAKVTGGFKIMNIISKNLNYYEEHANVLVNRYELYNGLKNQDSNSA